MLSIQIADKNQKDVLFDRNVTDVMKFVACLMVAMSHYSGYVLANGLSANIIFKAIAATGGYLGVALFFFLSGYGLMMSGMKTHLGFMDFLKRRLSRTYLPAVLVSAIWLGINIMIQHNWGSNLLCNQYYFLGVVWRFNDEVMWFVQTIIVLYLFFYLYRFISLLLNEKISRIAEPLFLLILGAIATPLVRWADIGDPISVPLFFIGIAIARWQKETRMLFRNRWVLLAIMGTILLVAYMGRADNRVLHGVINYLCMTLLIVLLTFFNITIPSLQKWVGACSYDLYLVHYKVHLLIVFLFAVDQLWMFALGTICATTGFYNLRKLCRL